MIVDDPASFTSAASALEPLAGAATTAKAALLVSPVGFRLAEESETDNRYMARGTQTSVERALAEHRNLAEVLRETLPITVFPGDAETPDAVFPNNVYATAPGRAIVGRMRHAVRRREAERQDVRRWMVDTLGYRLIDLSRTDGLVAELTGPLVIDHARGIGYCGLSGRCDLAGARAMHEAFGLRLTFVFELDPAEYHANVVLSVLAGRAVVLHAGSFANPEVPEAIASYYGDGTVWLDESEKLAYVGNCIALGTNQVWMGRRAERSLRAEGRDRIERQGFRIRSVPLDEIEKAGGSLRCCVAEIF
jgi:hypothetical protein